MRILDKREELAGRDFGLCLFERVLVAIEQIEKLPQELRDPPDSPYWRKEVKEKTSNLNLSNY